MTSIRSLLGWGLLLSFALLGPISLPAGGGSKLTHSIRRNNSSRSTIISEYYSLKSSPSLDSPSLRVLQAGTPISILKVWTSSHGDNWLLVKINSIELVDVIGLPKRGWVNV
tara:strand:- start:316 stop:651 length:336 start_codon:yes stop_codon:yes gene_type:complete